MDIEFSRKLLDVLIDNSLRILASGFGVNWAEASFFDVIRLLKLEGELKDYFLERTRVSFNEPAPGKLEKGIVPSELIELVAHEFRWPELLILADERVEKFFNGDETLAIGDIASRLSDAYNDDWQDREFYDHYKNNGCNSLSDHFS